MPQGLEIGDPYTACWALWSTTPDQASALQRSIDKIFSEYSFYPEIEWEKYGYIPPERYPLLGAWRHPDARVFAFLLDNPFMGRSTSIKQMILYLSGEKEEVRRFDSQINKLKIGSARAERKELLSREAGVRLDGVEKAKPLERLLKLVGLFTVIINALSLFLRSLSPPHLPSPQLIIAYQILVAAVHFSALFLLLLVTLIAIAYVMRYGLLLLRRF